nr:hypothetical protein [uncultured Eisenbergiella sp.]
MEIKKFYSGFRERAVEAKYLYAYHLMLAGEMMKLVIADGGVPADRLVTDGAQLSVVARGFFMYRPWKKRRDRMLRNY